MRKTECEFEADILCAVVQSRWPERVDAGLRNHAATCVICADVVLVAGAMECVHETTAGSQEHTLPDAGLVWWKAQLRARREAVETAGRPITAIHVVAFACAVGLMGACIGATSGWFQAALKRVWEGVTGFNVKSFIPHAAALIAGHGLLVACMAALVFGLPVAVYLAIGRD